MAQQKHTIISEHFFRRFESTFAPYLSQVGIDAAVFERPDIAVSERKYIALLETIARDGQPNLGLDIGRTIELDDLGPMGHALSHGTSVSQVLDALSRFMTVFSQASRVMRTDRTDRILITYRLMEPTILARRQDAEFAVSAILTFLQRITGEEIKPVRVDFEHPRPDCTRQHLAQFGCPVHFEQPSNTLHFAPEVMSLPVPQGNSRLFEALNPYLESQLQQRALADPTLLLITEFVAQNLAHGKVSLSAVSEHLATSPRTLQRKLRKHGLEFHQLLNGIRRDLALAYLECPEHSITQIAARLGYAESSAFSRAFRRWTGHTPLQHRQQRPA